MKSPATLSDDGAQSLKERSVTITAKRFDAASYRLLDETGTIVGFALALANGAWVPADRDGNRRDGMSFSTPAAVARWWSETQKTPPP